MSRADHTEIIEVVVIPQPPTEDWINFGYDMTRKLCI